MKPTILNIRQLPDQLRVSTHPIWQTTHRYVGRAGHGFDGYLGNPIDAQGRWACVVCGQKHTSGGSTLECYNKWLRKTIANNALYRQYVADLWGMKLACFCDPNPCHASILATVCEELNSSNLLLTYAGIGSRATPPNVIAMMEWMASYWGMAGWRLRSGGAGGADTAFEKGCRAAGGQMEIYLPWEGFMERRAGHQYIVASQLLTYRDAEQIAAAHHPAWRNLKDSHRLLHTRNVYQVLGADLQTPVDFAVCWTEGGLGGGGTGQAIRIAKSYDIPVYDLARREDLLALSEVFGK